jgi:hypothetical protein
MRRLRIMIDWAFALLFRPDVVKISLESEAEWVLRDAEALPASEQAGGSSRSAMPPQLAKADGNAAAQRA